MEFKASKSNYLNKQLTQVHIFKYILLQEKNLKFMKLLINKEFKTKKEKLRFYLKIFLKVWTAFGKYLNKLVKQGKVVGYNPLGWFYKDKDSDDNKP